MNTTGIRAGDLIRVDKKGRFFHAEVVGREGRELVVKPIEHNISYRRATSREVVCHWRKSRLKSQEKES